MFKKLLQKAFWLWRLLATASAFTLFGIGGMLVPFIAVPILYLLPGGQAKRQYRARQIVHWLFKIFVRYMRIVGILRWKVEGLEKLQRPGLLILANHPTLLDVVFLGSLVPNATCVVKSALRNNPAMRGFVSMTGYITNDDGKQLISASEAALQKGSSLLIFPEGTRSTKGEPMSFQRGASNIAVRCQKDVTPVIINCAPATLSKEHKWYNIPDRPFVMSFCVQEDIPHSLFAEGRATVASRKLTHYLEAYFTKESDLHAKRHS